jgi:glycosyltransferase involved in cell wall biosynthesis
MKIGLIIYGTLETLSGGYLYDRQLVSYLRATGCQVDIISLPWRTYPHHLCDNLRLTWARKIAQAGYDLLLQDELNHPSLFLLNHFLKNICDCPIISIVHHLRSSEEHPAHLLPLYQTIERHYLRTVDGFIFNSHTTKKIVEQSIEHPYPHVVAYPAADHLQPPEHDTIFSAIAQRLNQNEPLQLLFVGNLMVRKGLHTLLKALARLDDASWHLHIVGNPDIDPSYSIAMHQLANTLNLTTLLTWHGRINDQQLAHLYLTSDLLALPSYEGFGIVYLEAMAHGLPVLATTAGAAPELIHAGKNGYLITPDDDRTLAQHLTCLQTNRVHLATLAYHARQSYETHPTWQTSMQSIYLWLCEFKGQTHT